MLRTPSALSSNRSLLVLLVLAVALVALGAGRALVGGSFAPAAPVYGPADNPAPIAPAGEASFAPAPALETAIPAGGTALPGLASVRPTAAPVATGAPAATVMPHATVPVGPATTAAPGRDLPAIAPESAVPGFTPPPGRE